jgi:hypothetical protein
MTRTRSIPDIRTSESYFHALLDFVIIGVAEVELNVIVDVVEDHVNMVVDSQYELGMLEYIADVFLLSGSVVASLGEIVGSKCSPPLRRVSSIQW